MSEIHRIILDIIENHQKVLEQHEEEITSLADLITRLTAVVKELLNRQQELTKAMIEMGTATADGFNTVKSQVNELKHNATQDREVLQFAEEHKRASV